MNGVQKPHVVMFPTMGSLVLPSNKHSADCIIISSFLAPGNILHISSPIDTNLYRVQVIPIQIQPSCFLANKPLEYGRHNAHSDELLVKALNQMQTYIYIFSQIMTPILFFCFAQHLPPTLADQLCIKYHFFVVYNGLL